MAFTVHSEVFGDYESVQIIHEELDHQLVFIPDRGALPIKIKLFGVDIVEAIESPEVLEGDHWYRNFWLMPYPNRVDGGTYSHHQQEHHLTINEREKNNALHGFFYQLWAEDVSVENNGVEVTLTINHMYQADKPGYPFPFDSEIIYTIHENGTFDIGIKILNTGDDAMPFGIGWHPYFQLNGDLKSWTTSCGPLQHVELDDRSLPTGVDKLYLSDQSMTQQSLDDCFFYLEKPYRYTLASDTYRLILEQDDQFPYLQIFTPGRNSIAIEPMTCGVNAFNTKEGLMLIGVGQTKTFQLGLKLEPIE